MFYCEDCGEKRGWPTAAWLFRSSGLCEVCNKGAVCLDVPSRNLSMPKRHAASDTGGEEA